MLVDLIEAGLQSKEAEKERFFSLVSRLTESSDPYERERLGIRLTSAARPSYRAVMDRRRFVWTFLATALVVPPAHAQEPGKVPRIGVLGPRTRADAARYTDAFVEGLRDLGWVEGRNIVLEYRYAEGDSTRLTALAADLVRLKVDVILAGTSASSAAARKATSTIPIVTATSTPQELGYAATLARPGGNVTGLSYDVSLQTFGKGLELLKEVVPKARRIAVLSNPANPAQPLAVGNVRGVARSLDVQLHYGEARTAAEVDAAFAMLDRERPEAILVLADAFLASRRMQLHQHAARRRLPAMYGMREFTEAGGLMSYGPDPRDNFRRAAAYVDKILRGARPADLPIEQPTRFELVVNLKTAKALGLTFPRPFLLRADEVIE